MPPENRGRLQELTLEGALMLAVALTRVTPDHRSEPQPGDLVVEASWMHRPDPDAIGWLVGHGIAPYGRDDPLDGSVPMREVWDVIPLNPAARTQYTTEDGRGYQRWENASFVKVPDHVVKRMGWA